MNAQFARYDQNGDGFIERAEVSSANQASCSRTPKAVVRTATRAASRGARVSGTVRSISEGQFRYPGPRQQQRGSFCLSDPRFDYVIIGAGTAGCLLANRLSADPACRVLLVEAGGNDNYHWIHIPVGYLRCIGNPRTDWRYRTEPEPGLNGRDLLYPRGKVLGGSSSINGMIYMRGQARDYDALGRERQATTPGAGAMCCRLFRAHEDSFRREADPEASQRNSMARAANGA